MLDRLLSSSTIGVLERTLSFTEQRHGVILQNIANVSTPGYVQQDVSVKEFQKSLREALAKERRSFNGALRPESTDTVEFSGNGVRVRPQGVTVSPAFHDRGVRSPELLMSQLADNAEAHNMAAQFLRNRYDVLQRAISLKV